MKKIFLILLMTSAIAIAQAQVRVYINIEKPASGEGEMDAVSSVWLDGRNIWTYIIDSEKGTAKQLPSSEGVISLDCEKKKLSQFLMATMMKGDTL